MMKRATSLVRWLSQVMYGLAGLALVSIVCLTVTDVLLRRFWMPLDFAFEIVILLAAIAVSFSLPQTTLDKGHIITDFLVLKLPYIWRRAIYVITRVIALLIFVILSWRVATLAAKFARDGQISPILELPEYIVTYAVAFACFIECVVLFIDLFRSDQGGLK